MTNIGIIGSLPKDYPTGNNIPVLGKPEESKFVPQTMGQKIHHEEQKTLLGGPPIPNNLIKDFLNIVKKGNMNDIISFISKFSFEK